MKEGLILLISGILLIACETPNSDSTESGFIERLSSSDTSTLPSVVGEETKGLATMIVWEDAANSDFNENSPLGKFKEYDADGKLLLEGEQVEFNACSMNGGVWKYYDHYEVIYREVSYHLYCGEESTCHDTQVDLDIIEYYPNGNLKAKKYIHSCYECVQFKTGTWTYFNYQGDIDSTIVYDEMVECEYEELY